MKNEKQIPPEERRLSVIRYLTNLVILYPAFLAAVILLKVPLYEAWGAAALFFVLMNLLFFAHYVENLTVFLVMHFAGAAVAAFAAPGNRWVNGVLAVLAAWASMAGRAAGKRYFYPEAGWLVYPFVIYAFGTGFKNETVMTLAFAAEVVIVVLFIFYKNAVSLEHTFLAAKEHVRVPYMKIRKLNTAMLSLFLVLTAITVAVLGTLFDGQKIVDAVGRLLFTFYAAVMLLILKLLSLLPLSGGGTAAAAEEAAGAQEPLEAAANNPLLELIWLWLERIVLVITAAAILFIIYYLLKEFVFDLKASDAEGRDVRKRIDRAETKKKIPREKESGLSVFDFSPAARIRRLYLGYMKLQPGAKNIRSSETPEEQMETAGCVSDAREEIRALYEEARYAPERADAGRLAAMREAIERPDGGFKPLAP